MASGDTKTNQYLDVAANGTRADLPSDTCCETRSQTLIREVAERIMDVEDEVERLENNPDVVDIVDTYEDLEDYDTSTLTDKDIIRVLNDETHDGESTYYRYDKQSGTFTYIGSAGGSGGSGIPTDATFWGRPYDSNTNSVHGALLVHTNDNPREPYFDIRGTSLNGDLSYTWYGGILFGESSGEVGFGRRRISANQALGETETYAQFGQENAVNVLKMAAPIFMNWTGRESGTFRQIKGLADPTANHDAVNKQYVDTIVGDIETALHTINNGGGQS